MEWQNPSPARDHDACGVGFIAQLGGSESREVIERALVALERLSHRGGVDADGASGDGAGLLTAIPRKFFRDQARQLGIQLPATYAVGMAFLPSGKEKQEEVFRCITESVDAAGLKYLGFRKVPTDPGVLGHRAESTLPVIRQFFFAPANPLADFEMELFLFRKRVEAIAPEGTYFCSLSSRTLVYKGLLAPHQLAAFYPDIAHPDYKSPFAVFHQRYSTNTRPVWALAQPFRMVAHNGEINTISANRRWMRARESFVREAFGAGGWFHCLQEHVSDSASFDNSFEILIRQNLNPAAAMMRMVPPAWENDARMSPELRAFLQSQACEQEPWDGPAALVFSDGQYVGAKLDRNGLRPMRYTVGSNGLVVAGSEVGIADFSERQIERRGRLGPGEMLLVDLLNRTLHRNHELSGLLTTASGALARPSVSYLLPSESGSSADSASVRCDTPHPRRTAAALGWTEDQFRILFQPLCADGKEAVWSMGDDAPPAFLSEMQRPLWDYCKQRFAQVTNPPIDPLREAHVMSLDLLLTPELGLRSPVLDAEQMEKVANHLNPESRIDITFDAALGVRGALAALASLRGRVMAGSFLAPRLVVLSDRGVGKDRAALPILLAVAAAWKALVSTGAVDVPMVVESGQVFDTHHVALLVACGASGVFPHLAAELANEITPGGATKLRTAIEGGLRKVLARMGISTLASYRNSHLFETVGLDAEVHREFFEDAAHILAGKSLNEILEDALARHAAAYANDAQELRDLGYYRFRKNGELHATSPELVRNLHAYIKTPTPENYERFRQIAGTRESVAVRDNLEFAESAPIALDEVEPREKIFTRFSSQAMSLGAISPEAHRALAVAMNQIGARSNTGEGGEDPEIYMNSPEAANRVKQVASGRFGVSADYLVHADELEIKMAQGSKPGEGGQLPGFKVTPYIARMRHAVTGMSLISPPPHHDIYSIEDLAQLIYDLRAINPRARIGVKLVAGAGVGIIAAGVAKAGADVITISGHDGGTGASPLTSIKNTGLPWEVGIREAHCELLQAGLRSRVRLRVDGGLKFGRDVVVAAMLGADEFGFGTAALLAIGCVMARQCHLNTCPVGIATQDEKLRTRFAGKPEMVVSYFAGVADEVRELLANLGARSLEEIRGRVELLVARKNASSKAISGLLESPRETRIQLPNLTTEPAGVHRQVTRIAAELEVTPHRSRTFSISNSDRSTGATLSGELLRRFGNAGLEDKSVDCEFHGSAGQSFGAFLTSGVTFRLKGEANDCVGKGLSGGVVAVSAGYDASRRGDVLVGNTVLYGATSGELYVAGRAGERFAVRNSGALAVVEGIGQHGCEYMTAGVVLALGPVGTNFGSGMTGGLAYCLKDAVARMPYNREFVMHAHLDEQEELWLRRVLREHLRLTGSAIGEQLLRARLPLPLARVQPVKLPTSIAHTWAETLARYERRQAGTELPMRSVWDGWLPGLRRSIRWPWSREENEERSLTPD